LRPLMRRKILSLPLRNAHAVPPSAWAKSQ
jgi:hypothetical protein